jgi:RNA polymerase sigma-70 factor (ECF subfamily)
VQEFFARFLENHQFQVADPQRGRFRSFLLGALNHFLANEWRRMTAQKRGGGRTTFSFDPSAGETRYRMEPAHDLTPEKMYERRWAMTVLDGAMSDLRAEYERRGKLSLFEKLAPMMGGPGETPCRHVAAELGMSEAAVKVALHRLRRRCREHLRAQVAQTVCDPGEVDEELQELLAAVGG